MHPLTKAKYPKDWRTISEETISQRHGLCQKCGIECDGVHVLTVHHKDYDPSNNNPDNLEVLCQGCHFRRQIEDKKYGLRSPAQMEMF